MSHQRDSYLGTPQAKQYQHTIAELRAEIKRLRAALQSLTTDPPATFAQEPDTDAEVITKMRWIARRALEPKP